MVCISDEHQSIGWHLHGLYLADRTGWYWGGKLLSCLYVNVPYQKIESNIKDAISIDRWVSFLLKGLSKMLSGSLSSMDM